MAHRWRRLVSTVVLAAAVLGTLFASAAPAMAHAVVHYDNYVCAPGNGSGICNGQDPQSTGCSNDGTTIAAQYVKNNYGQNEAYVELRWSNACGTNWVRITSMYYYTSMHATIWDYDYGSPSYSSRTINTSQGNIGDVLWTPMIYAPNNSVSMCGYITVNYNWQACGYY